MRSSYRVVLYLSIYLSISIIIMSAPTHPLTHANNITTQHLSMYRISLCISTTAISSSPALAPYACRELTLFVFKTPHHQNIITITIEIYTSSFAASCIQCSVSYSIK